MTEWRDVSNALLGSWPTQVASWGREVIVAYLAEVAERGVTPDQALEAIRTWPVGSDFPPSAPHLAALVRRGMNQPTFIEMFQLVYGRGGILRAREPYRGPVLDPDESRARAAKVRLATCHPLVASFVERYGLERLRLLELNDPEYGGLRRKELREAWDRHVEAMDGRAVAVVALSHRDDLGRLDPLAVLGVSESGGDLNA